ncbi:hypothetical protein ACFSQJ_12175 [Croceitalea marina]|uniref:Outer membrane protein beta-barrel domain-containing protein n=1 Tax=Croceitalea marina TaxID=1775166 RepID=A0ABW5N0E8_9FLAO
MKNVTTILVSLLLFFLTQNVVAQSSDYQKKIETLKKQKEKITQQEKKALKLEVEEINKRVERGSISSSEAETLKAEAAKKRALNIDNRLAIIDNRIALLERNDGDVLSDTSGDSNVEDQIRIGIDVNGKPFEEIFFSTKNWKRELKYDRRTYSDFVMAIGLNNALIDGQSLDDSPYKIGGSRFFELGVQWRTRVFKNSNFMRLNYGFSFQFNGLKPNDNQFFVENGGQTELQEFDLQLRKSKLRMDNLVFPVHFEFGPSKFKETEKTIRYSIYKQFRFGIGAYGGFNIGTRQKLKYDFNGERVKDKFKRDYNTSDLIYGLSAYTGVGGTLLYIKYDLNPIFKDAAIKQRNISLGLRFDL